MMKKLGVFVLVAMIVMSGCTAIHRGPRPCLLGCARWAVFPFTNLTATPRAGERARAIAANILRIRGVRDVICYEQPVPRKRLLPFIDQPVTKMQAIGWARAHGARYAVTGKVIEWRYKVGLDGEPAVAITMRIYDTYTGRIVWSAVGSKVGTSRSALGMIAQKLVYQTLASVPVK